MHLSSGLCRLVHEAGGQHNASPQQHARAHAHTYTRACAHTHTHTPFCPNLTGSVPPAQLREEFLRKAEAVRGAALEAAVTREVCVCVRCVCCVCCAVLWLAAGMACCVLGAVPADMFEVRVMRVLCCAVPLTVQIAWLTHVINGVMAYQ